jgi:hypothetical protein
MNSINLIDFYTFHILPLRDIYNSVTNQQIIKDKAVPLQAWSGPEGSRKLR